MYVIGSEVTAFTASSRGAFRSITWVAPKDLRRSTFRKEAVAMMGLNPESLAIWMTGQRIKINILSVGRALH